MTVCNMSIEGGARCGYVNPDETTFAYLRGRELRAEGRGLRARGRAGGARCASDPDAHYDDRVELDGAEHRADRHLGHQPGPERAASTSRSRAWPTCPTTSARRLDEAYGYMGLRPRRADRGHDDRRRASSARARTAASAICARPRASRARARVAAGRARARGARLAGGGAPGRGGGPRRGVPRRRLRVARARLLDVPRDEPRQAGRPRAVRVVVQPQLQGPPGLARPAARC